MKVLKRLVPIYIIMVYCVIALSGCAAVTDYAGKEMVDRAKKLHTGLEAAHITVREYVRDEGDPVNGAAFAASPVVQEIWYRFAGDVMQYMYIGRDPESGEEYYEFNNGTELDTWHTGDEKWAFAAKGSEGFYNYSRTSRHYFADGDRLLDDHLNAVKSSFVSDQQEGQNLIFIGYDSEMIAQNGQMAGVQDYSQAYYINPAAEDGLCREQQIQYRKDGKIYIFDMFAEPADPAAPIERAEPAALSGEITEG